jgi:multiple sugar transport system substrate-binding protein
MTHTRLLKAVVGVALAGLALSACGSPSAGPTTAASQENVQLVFRTWDDTAAKAYEQSFADFTKANPNITVKTEVVAWADYFTKLRTDIAGGNAPDVFWLNNSNLAAYARNGNLVDVNAKLGADAASAWEPSVVKQFTVDDKLWGVPQTSDGGIAVYYNKKLLADAGLKESDIASLAWSPSGGDNSLLTVAEKLTRDSSGKTADQTGFNPGKVTQWGYNAAYDLQAILLPFIGSNGGTYQNGDQFTFSNPKTVEAVSYLVDLINKYHVAPSAANTNTNGDFSRDQFLQGKIALFQSGLYNLANVASGAKFDWGVVNLPKGPAGAVSVTNGVAAVGNAASKHEDATIKLMQWLGSKDGNAAIGSTGANLPGVTAAQQGYKDYWAAKKVDLTPFFSVIASGVTIPAPTGENFNAGYEAYDPILQEVFLGRKPVADGLKAADDAANKAIQG